jgi:hypothetical protein
MEDNDFQKIVFPTLAKQIFDEIKSKENDT